MTSTELERAGDSAITVLPPARPVQQSALANLDEQVQAMAKAHHIAKVICNSSMGGRFRGKPDDGAVAILYGAEVGLNPQQAMHKVVVVHGMPTLEARTMVALLKRQGYRIRATAQSDESVTVQGIDLEGDVFESTWTIERAIKAGYVPTIDEKTGKFKTNANGKLIGNEKYLTDPQAMLKAKAQAEVCRDMAPDVLLGISYTQEELESERWEQQPQQQSRPALSQQPVTVEEIFEPAAEPAEVDAEVQETDADGEAGRDGGNDQSQGATPSSGAETLADSGDQPTPEPEPEPVATSPEPAPEQTKPAKKTAPPKSPASSVKSKYRDGLEKRLFKLIGDIQPKLSDEDRYLLYSFILGKPGITSTNDLDDYQVAKVGDELYVWSQNGELNDKVRDALNSVDIAAENAQPTTEGE